MSLLWLSSTQLLLLALAASMSGIPIGIPIGPLQLASTPPLSRMDARLTLPSSPVAKHIMVASHQVPVFRAFQALRLHPQQALAAWTSGMLIGIAIGPLQVASTLHLFPMAGPPTLLSSLAAKPIMLANHQELVFRACPAHRQPLQLVLVA